MTYLTGGHACGSKLVASWGDIAYQAGTLTAIGYDAAGNAAEKKTVTSAGAATSIRLTADRSKIMADRRDLSFVTAEVVDANGTYTSSLSWSTHCTSQGPALAQRNKCAYAIVVKYVEYAGLRLSDSASRIHTCNDQKLSD